MCLRIIVYNSVVHNTAQNRCDNFILQTVIVAHMLPIVYWVLNLRN